MRAEQSHAGMQHRQCGSMLFEHDPADRMHATTDVSNAIVACGIRSND